MKVIFSGLEDSGKSYKLAQTAVNLAYRNAGWLELTGVPRPIVSNLEFSSEFFSHVTEELGVPIKYWRDLEELPNLTQADLIMDEVASYFDSRTFKDLPLEIRLWLSQASKLGVDIFGSAQDFAQVDLSFRRLTTHLYHITKLIGSQRPATTRPPVKCIWGLCVMKELDPVGYDESKKSFSSSGVMPSFFFIQRRYCEVFDTTRRIARSSPPPFKHVARRCEVPDCRFEMYDIIGGHKHRVQHV